ncbi:hypothetical protein [Streptomyces vinaceus]|uniref:hypothetical protein n=1 Tax=Streptomyces vinaceus TaxID=1960 RepID=UPI0038008C25
MWFPLAVHGTDAYADAIEKTLTLARSTAKLVRRTPHLELIREPELARLLAGQTEFVAPTGWEGWTVARFAFLHPDTTPKAVEEIIDTMA